MEIILDKKLKALANQTRCEILEYLRSGPHTAGEIADQFCITGSSVSRHLSILRQSALIFYEKAGQYRMYGLNGKEMEEVLQWLFELEK